MYGVEITGQVAFNNPAAPVLDVNYLGRYASTTLAAFELFLS